MSIVALDVDGVLTDFDAHWRQCAEQVLGRPIPKIGTAYHFRSRCGLTAKEYGAVWDAYHADEWHRLPSYSYAADLIFALEDLGCEVWAVTSVDARHEAARASSLNRLIPQRRIVCVGYDAPANAKADALRDLDAVAFLDDHPANANAALGVKTMLVSALLDHGYTGLVAPEHGVAVINDPMAFPVLVEQALRRTARCE